MPLSSLIPRGEGKSGGFWKQTMRAAHPLIAILGIRLESNAFAPAATGDNFRAPCHFEGEAGLG